MRGTQITHSCFCNILILIFFNTKNIVYWVQPINSVVIVSGEGQRVNSHTYTGIHSLPNSPLIHCHMMVIIYPYFKHYQLVQDNIYIYINILKYICVCILYYTHTHIHIYIYIHTHTHTQAKEVSAGCVQPFCDLFLLATSLDEKFCQKSFLSQLCFVVRINLA